MFDLVIFTKAPKAYEPQRYIEEAIKLKLNVKIMVYPRMTYKLDEDYVEVLHENDPIPEAKMVVFRAAGGDGYYIPQRDYLIGHFLKADAKVLNKDTYIKWSRLDKITQHFEFQKGRIPFIKTINFGANRKLIDQYDNYPSIAKHNLSSQGRDVYKLDSQKDAVYLLDNYRARTLLVQPFLKAGEDIRVIVIDGKAIGAMKRIAQKGSYLTNYSQGGRVVAFDLSKDSAVVDIAEKTAKHFLCDYVGVDLMKDDDGDWRVLEINRSCQFQGFELSTKINVPEKVIEFLR